MCARRQGVFRVRLSALLCLQSMAKSDSRAMQPHWTALLPVQQPLQPRPLAPHLVTVLLWDPVQKVREAPRPWPVTLRVRCRQARDTVVRCVAMPAVWVS